MLFTSVIYFLFLAGSLFLYYVLHPRFRNYFLIIISALFYMYVKPEYIFIIIYIIVSNYFLGKYIEKVSGKRQKRQLLNFSLFINLGILVFFKYWNFTLGNLVSLMGIFHLNSSIPFLEVALPLGLSYYIFQTIGYNLDIYRGTLKAERNFFHFSLFTLFFPKLLVGPIERANHFLPQLNKWIYFNKDNIIDGSKRIIWGLFKKLVVADRISIFQTTVFNSPDQQSGLTLLFAAILYTFQVYADFSGYTDIALGTAKMFGLNLMENFKRPLLAKNIGDFWRRWHISLSSWVNDYIFNPLALNHRNWGKWAIFYALIISFVVIGIWHGASWNYIAFGFLQALVLIYEFKTRKQRIKISKKFPKKIYTGLSVLITFMVVTFSLIIFRSGTFEEINSIISGIFSNKGSFYYDKSSTLLFMLIGCGIMMLYDLQEEFKTFKFSIFSNKNWFIQQIFYAFLIIYILLAGVFDGGQFIYFAF